MGKVVVGKPGARKAATDATRPVPTKKAFYLAGKVVAFQGQAGPLQTRKPRAASDQRIDKNSQTAHSASGLT